jgi:acyl-CoA thioester hydrolase
MEEARLECLRSLGLEFAELVALGCDLPVVELQVRYHRALRMGMPAVVRLRLEPVGVRLNFEYQIQSPDGQALYLTARVTLVPVDRHKNKIVRQLPPALEAALARL